MCVGTCEYWHTDFRYNILKSDVVYYAVSHKLLYESLMKFFFVHVGMVPGRWCRWMCSLLGMGWSCTLSLWTWGLDSPMPPTVSAIQSQWTQKSFSLNVAVPPQMHSAPCGIRSNLKYKGTGAVNRIWAFVLVWSLVLAINDLLITNSQH